MPNKININKLINDPEALKKTSWSALQLIQKQYPFSNIVSVLMAKKQFLESGNMDSENFETALKQRNNPGITFTNLHRWEEPKPGKKENNNIKEPKNIEKISKKRKTESAKVKTKEKVKVKPEKIKTIIKNDSEIRNDFTKWLLDKDSILNESKYKTEKVNIQEAKSISDESSLLKDEIISESLAKVYVKQGLIREALEMYQKLSLKSPKKSSYFAAIIENLKKN